MLLYVEANWKDQEKTCSALNRVRCWVYMGYCLVNWLSKCSVFVMLYIIFLEMASKNYNTEPATT